MKRSYGLVVVLLFAVFSGGCAGLQNYMQTKKALKSGYVTQKDFVRQVPFEKYASSKIIIEATINQSSRKYRFMLDSGASMVLSKEVAQELGLIRPGKSNFPSSLVLDKVQIAGLSFAKVGTLLWDLKADPFLAKCARVDGLIGSSVLKHFIWQFDWRNEKILVSDRVDSLVMSASAIRLPFTSDGYNRAMVACKFPNGKTKKFIFDTGGNGFTTNDQDLFDALKAQVPYRVTYGLASYGSLKEPIYDTSYTAWVPDLKVGRLVIDAVEVLFAKGQKDYVGWQFLKNYKVPFDWQTRTITLVPYVQQVPLDNPLSFGFSLFYHFDTLSNQKHLIVAAVTRDSPADQAGLKVGDRVVEVEGRDYRIITDECEVFEGLAVGEHQTQLTILRGNNRQTITVNKGLVFKR